MASAQSIPRPARTYIGVGANGAPFIEGHRCTACGAKFTEDMLACRACGSRTQPKAYRAPETGCLHTWSVVHRSYPGIEVPFISAIVDLDDGLTLKGTLREVSIDALHQGMPVRLVFDDAGGATSKDGAPYIGYHFIPAGDAA